MERNRRKGVITPFAAVSLILVISLLFTLLEGTRIGYGKVLSNQQAAYAAQSFLGQYDTELLTNYGVYGVHGDLYSNREEILEQMSRFITPIGAYSLLNPTNGQLQEMKYRLLTDDGGKDFRKQAIESYLYELPQEIIDDLAQKYDFAIGIGDESTEKEILDDAWEAIEEAEELKNADTNRQRGIQQQKSYLQGGSGEKSGNREETTENPMDTMKTQKSSFTLSMVLPEGYQISNGTMDITQSLVKRELKKGTMGAAEDSSIDEKIIFPFYLKKNFTHALSKQEEGVSSKENGLKYQLEYLLIGKSTDVKNLEGVVNRLILFREMVWFTYRVADSASRQQALSIATAIMSGVGVPALIEPVALGILLAWSYADAVKDTGKLMNGESVALIPKLGNSGKEESGDAMKGLTFKYEDYLLLFIALKDIDVVTLRTLDVVEQVLGSEEREFCADQIITAVEGTLKYRYDFLFADIGMVVRNNFTKVYCVGAFKQGYCM